VTGRAALGGATRGPVGNFARVIASSSAAGWFLWIVSSVFLVAYALPLAFVPLRWARAFRWRVEGDDHLTVYLGRCLGVVAIALVAAGYRAAADPERNAIVLEIFAAAAFLLAAVHVWGAIARRQPWTETAEIAVYLGLGVAATWIRVTL
jgi:hypothetical protein